MNNQEKCDHFRTWIKEHPLFSMDDVPTGWAAQISTIAINYADQVVAERNADKAMDDAFDAQERSLRSSGIAT